MGCDGKEKKKRTTIRLRHKNRMKRIKLGTDLMLFYRLILTSAEDLQEAAPLPLRRYAAPHPQTW